jgi:hypothetical protein
VRGSVAIRILVATLVLPGCVGTLHTAKRTWSSPVSSTRGVWRVRETDDKTAGELLGPAVRLVVRAENERVISNQQEVVVIPLPPYLTKEDPGRSPFVIRVEGHAAEPGFAIDLHRAELVVGRASPITPIRVTECVGDQATMTTPTVPLSAVDGCARLEYDRPTPSSSTPFTLRLLGLTRDTALVDLPPLDFVERYEWILWSLRKPTPLWQRMQ